ncbi:putative lysin [Liberibacter phage P-PA19-1]|nr:putative lysin [Liberibacter phage P-PA19-1]
MGGLDLKRTFSESVAPNQDAVKDRVTSASGFKDLAVSIENATKVLEKVRKENIYGDANVKFTEISAKAESGFMEYANSLPMDDIDKLDKYPETLRGKYQDYIATIPNRDVRQHFSAKAELDIRGLHHKALEMKIGSETQKAKSNFTNVQNNLIDKLISNPSDEQYSRSLKDGYNHIDLSPLTPEDKEKAKRDYKDVISREQIRADYVLNPGKYAFYIKPTKSAEGSKLDDLKNASEILENSREQTLTVAEELKGSRGCLGWKELNNDKRRAILAELVKGDNAANVKRKRELGRYVKDIETRLDKGERPPEIEGEGLEILLAKLMETYGVDAGYEAHQRLKFKSDIAPAVSQIKTMTPSDADSFFEILNSEINSLAPHSLNQRNLIDKYEKLHKARTTSITQLQQDPIKWGIDNKKIDPLRFDTPKAFADSIAQYTPFAKWAKEHFGLNINLFHNSGGKLIKDQFMRGKPQESVDLVQHGYNLLSDMDKQSFLTSANSMEDKDLSAVITLSTEYGEEAVNAAQTILIGMKSRKEVEKDYKVNNSQSAANTFDKHADYLIIRHIEGIQESSIGATLERDRAAIKLYLIGDMKMTHNYVLSRKRVSEATKKVLGSDPVYVNGLKLMPPRGMSEGQFLDSLWYASKSVGEFDPYKSTYMSVGGGKYILVSRGAPKLDQDGNVIIIDPRTVPINKIKEAKAQREEYIKIKHYENMIFNENAP